MIDQAIVMPYASSVFPAEEDVPVTFQIVLIGSDGLVAASDRKQVYVSQETGGVSAQRLEGDKFLKSPNESIICFCAGDYIATNIGREIVTEDQKSLKLSDVEWERALQKIAGNIDKPPLSFPNEIIVIRRDRPEIAWVVTKYSGSSASASVVPVTTYLCTGGYSKAQFLPEFLWDRQHSVSKLEVLARLAVRYASLSNPSGVGMGCDLLTVQLGNVRWQHFPADSFEEPFTESMRRALDALSV